MELALIVNSKNAAITIISKNYFSFAKTLAESYKKYHPQNDFIIVLVDQAEGYVPQTLDCGAEIVEISKIGLPDLANFIYRYSIMELNTAVKPFALDHFFSSRSYDTLLYIDPDIWIFHPLTEVYSALENASVVLTPHMREPYYDSYHPTDTSILQSGTYNLGFLGLKRGSESRLLLDWWMAKLYRDCVVDIPKGLFVDQKWMDLVPGFIQKHKIIYHPGYNVAYWNLHERRISYDAGTWVVEGKPLVFFHFSGYLPIAPNTLSKHQNRHKLNALPDLKSLTDAYAAILFDNGYEDSSDWPYAFQTLDNGVSLPLKLVREVMQWVSRNSSISAPNPLSESDAFCKFLMRKGLIADKPKTSLILHFLLLNRPDVARVFPAAIIDTDNQEFRGWLKNTGASEEGLFDLLSFETEDNILDYVADSFSRLREKNRDDVFVAYQDMWINDAVFNSFANWFTAYGIDEEGFEEEHTQRLLKAKGGISKILNIYFLRGDIQVAFPNLYEDAKYSAFSNWLRSQTDLELSPEEVSLFDEFAYVQRDLIEKMRFLYQTFGRNENTLTTIYDIDASRYNKHIILDSGKILDWLSKEGAITPVDHYVNRFGKNTKILEDYEKTTVLGLKAKENFAFLKSVRESFSKEQESTIINFAGFLSAPSGMGESARSMLATLQKTNIKHSAITLPHPRAQSSVIPKTPALFGWPSSMANISITVANADTNHLVESFLPKSYWTEKNIGYWVWETEELPPQFKLSETLFNEIWTPSTYSAKAIKQTTSLPVKVLPHTLDFVAIDKAKSDRAHFGLPQKAVLFGFIFDPQSVLERKNVQGLVDAFRLAFAKDDNCYLILKANGRTQGAYDYETIKAKADSDRIIFIESTLSREKSYDFMKSLDVYVSLHRSEGFGLTCAEAMAMSIPVVASDYSGNLEFMNAENSLLVPTRVIETTRTYGAYPAGTRWGDPDIEKAAESMRALLNQKLRLAIGNNAAKSVRSLLSHENIASIAKNLILEL